MHEESKNPANNIRFFRRKKNLSQQALAELSGLGTGQSGKMKISRLEKGKISLTTYHLEKIAPVLEVAVFDLINTTTQSEVDLNVKIPYTYRPPDMIPIYGYAAADNGEAILMNDGKIVETVPRHWTLEGVKDAFMIYVRGESMYPRYYSGDLLVIHPGRSPKRGEDCLIEFNNKTAIVKVYKGQKGDKVICSQFNPETEIEYPLDTIQKIYAVVGRSN